LKKGMEQLREEIARKREEQKEEDWFSVANSRKTAGRSSVMEKRNLFDGLGEHRGISGEKTHKSGDSLRMAKSKKN